MKVRLAEVEVCTGPRASAGPGLRTGSGLVAQIMFGSGPSRAIIFSKEKVIRSSAHLVLVTQSGS
jgi:hypothetical protein